MGRKPDVRQVEEVALALRMTEAERIEFGYYIEDCKRHGDRGSKNDRGDFTWDELMRKGREFPGDDR